MKKLSIIVRSEKLDDVKAILDECGSTGATVSNIMGYGNQKGIIKNYRKECEKRSTGKVGDGKIFVYDVADVIRIRTGEHGDTAL